MKYQLINRLNQNFSTIQQILYNRGIPENEIQHYINLSQSDVNSFLLLGEDRLKAGASRLISTIRNLQNAIIIVDCDCDGYTSAALLVNYLFDIFPTWVENHLQWIVHNEKQHGLKDCVEYLLEVKPALVICPDSSSNDYFQHEQLRKNNIQVLILDHHLAEHISENAITINNQLSDYPNKELSGVGIVWQFCRYLDNLLNCNYANEYLDLVALGLTGDMMSLRSKETKFLISKGFKKQNIKNPFIDYMIDKNSFSLSKSDYITAKSDMACTPIGAAFFIVPFVNAITRSGTKQQKQLLFLSMLKHKAFAKILSNKRGHNLGEEEQLILQAIRTVVNVKNRQTKAEKAGMDKLEKIVENDNMLENKILVFLLEPNQLEAEIRGLIANKMMAKYQRPCLILTRTIREDTQLYEGSGRGYTKTGISNLKQILEQCPEVVYAEGHQNAFGIGIQSSEIGSFIKRVNFLLKDISSELLYRIDYNFNEHDNIAQTVLDIANMNDYWGQDIERAYVNINFKITNSNFQVMKSNTLKFNLSNGVSIIKFNGTEEEINCFSVSTGFIEVNAICKCCENNWGGQSLPQLLMQDYEIIDSCQYLF